MTDGSKTPGTLGELALVTCRQHFAAILRSENAARSGDDPELQPILAAHRREAQEKLLAVLDAPQTRRGLEAWSDHGRSHATRGKASTQSIRSFAADAVRKRHKRLRKAEKSLSGDSSADDYHAVRSRVKRLRYALEVFTPLHGRRAEKYVQTLSRLQDTLGEYHDAEVSRRRDEDRVRERREEADDALPRVSGKRWKKLRSRLSHPTKKRAEVTWPSLQASS